jgi:hypothetical protein
MVTMKVGEKQQMKPNLAVVQQNPSEDVVKISNLIRGIVIMRCGVALWEQ